MPSNIRMRKCPLCMEICSPRASQAQLAMAYETKWEVSTSCIQILLSDLGGIKQKHVCQVAAIRLHTITYELIYANGKINIITGSWQG